MEYMDKLRDKLCKELDEIANKGELGAGDLELIHKLTDTIKNIEKIEKLSEGGYSHDYSRDYVMDGDWETRGNYERGNSYRNRKRDSRGRYSRDYGRDYSEARDDMIGRMEDMLRNASGKDKETIRRYMEQLERM